MFHFERYKGILKVLTILILLFFIWSFKVSSDINFILCQILFISYSLLILLILQSGLFKYIFEPPIFFLIFSFIYEFLKFPYYFQFDIPERLINSDLKSNKYEISDYYGNSALLLAYQIICITGLLVGYIIIKKKEFIPPEFIIKQKDYHLIVIASLFLISAAIGLYSITGGNFLLLLTRRAGNTDATEILQSNYLVAFSAYVSLITLSIVISIRIFQGTKWKSLLFLYLCNALLSYLISGSRGAIIYSIFAILLIASSNQRIKLSITKIVIAASVVLLLFSFLGLVRRSMSDTNNIISNFEERLDTEDKWYTEITGYQLQLRDEMVFNNAHKAGFIHGVTYLNLIFSTVPRSIAGELKPEFVDKLVGVNFYNRDDVGLPLNAMGEAYYNFSYFGVLLFVLLGSIMAKLRNKIVTAPITTILISCILLIFAQTWSTTYLVYVVQYLLVMFIPLFYLKRKRQQS